MLAAMAQHMVDTKVDDFSLAEGDSKYEISPDDMVHAGISYYMHAP